MSCGDAWCAGGYRARRRAAERTTTGRRVRMFGVRDIMSRRIARARRAGGRELRRCGLRVDDKKRKIGIASCFMRYLCRGGELRGRPRVPRCSGPYPMQPSAAASFCGTTAARKLAFGRTIRGRFGRRTRFDRAGNPEVMDVLGFRDYCLSLPLSGEPTPFDETTLVCKIGGRMYACADRAESVALRSSATPGRRSPCVKDMPKRSLPVVSIKSIGPAFVRRAICPMRVSASRFAAPACSFSKALRPGPAGKRSAPASKNRDCYSGSPDSFRPVSRPALRGKPRHTPARGSSVVPTAYWGLSCAGMPLSAYPFVASFLARPAWMRFRSGVSRLRFSKCLPPRCILVADRFRSVFAFIYSPCTASPGADSAAFRRRDGFHTLRPCLRRAGPQRCQNNR